MLVLVTVKKARNKGIKARNVEKVKRIEIKKEESKVQKYLQAQKM